MVLTRYSLEEFVHDMTELIAQQPDQSRLFDRGSRYLERFVRNPEALPEIYRRPAGIGKRPSHGNYARHRSDGLFVSAVVWGPGEHVGPHDHRTWGMIGVIGNAIEETRFRRVDDRSRAGYAQLIKDRTTTVLPGDVSLLTPETDEIHQMDNTSDRPTVEIHVYGTDLVGLARCTYNLETGEVKGFASGKFDNC